MLTKSKISQETVSQMKDIPAEEVLKRMQSSNNGFGKAEVERRLAEYGYNEIFEKKVNPLLKFLSYFWGPIPMR